MYSIRVRSLVSHADYFCKTISAITQPVDGSLGGKVKRVPGSAGILMPGVKARIVLEDGTDAKVDQPGELWIQSDIVALGYHNNEKANRETFKDGWLLTGDHFKVDKDGNFWCASFLYSSARADTDPSGVVSFVQVLRSSQGQCTVSILVLFFLPDFCRIRSRFLGLKCPQRRSRTVFSPTPKS